MNYPDLTPRVRCAYTDLSEKFHYPERKAKLRRFAKSIKANYFKFIFPETHGGEFPPLKKILIGFEIFVQKSFLISFDHQQLCTLKYG
jgi:hypothetical protein